MPCRRSGSGSTTNAARRSASAPSWSPLSSFSRPRAASAFESSDTGSGAGTGGTAAICGGETLVGAPSDAGEGAAAAAVDGDSGPGATLAGGAAAVEPAASAGAGEAAGGCGGDVASGAVAGGAAAGGGAA
jgi:hypothetical protein